ncbi:MAG: DNA mismatch repair endonuclease MutL [Bacteroidetes bacterium]|nr:DNA mismatch repair endonuclease MutL [Bacteroidota bacterium]
MHDLIHLLPDSVANQIAAGEVIQRPASLVKELVENAVDSGSTEIKIIIKNAGKTLVQVIDNGCGMSETDARMAFERHATSKISKADDLFEIRTLGFRGEALASIGAVSQVELKTRRKEDDLGTLLRINGTKVETQEPTSCSAGSNFAIKNLFYNIPARRRFLKSNQTELKHIIVDFQRVALSHPDIKFIMHHNGYEIYHLLPGNLRQRIVSVFSRSIDQNLIPLETETNIVEITGFVGKPENAKKTFGEQFFFINKRFMRHPYFHRAVMDAYEGILPPETFPSYFIFMSANPRTIDINIHPTKTEIKFEDERSVWQILHASIKETLGKFNIIPSLDFNTEGSINIPVRKKDGEIIPPFIKTDPAFNPFEREGRGFGSTSMGSYKAKQDVRNWEKLYSGLEKNDKGKDWRGFSADNDQQTIVRNQGIPEQVFFQVKKKYILCTVKSGLMVIDQKRAHERILYENYLHSLKNELGNAQKELFPQTIEIESSDWALIEEILDDLNRLGFDIRKLGNNSLIVNGLPSYTGSDDPQEIIEIFLEDYKSTEKDIETGVKEKIARSMARASAIPYGKQLSIEEMRELIDSLFATKSPNYSPTGKTVIYLMPLEELEKRFK